jgi:hypothetical protein
MTITHETLVRSLSDLDKNTPKALSQFQPANPDLGTLESMLAVIPANAARGDGSIFGRDDLPVEYWFGVMLAVRREWGEPAKDVLRKWSQAGDRYTDEGFEQAWNQFDRNHSKPVTINSLDRLARKFGWQKPAQSSRYSLLHREAIMDLKPIEWRLKGVFPRVGIGAIFGPSGSGKSFLAIDLGLCIASGREWYGRKTTACAVSYLMLEGEAGLRNRIFAWEVLNESQIPLDFAGVTQSFGFSEAQDVADLASALPEGGVVIIDTLNRAAPGKDENSSKDMGDVLAGMKELQRLTKGLVLVVHHTGKDVSKGLRGHSSLHAALDGAIEVKRGSTGRSWSAAKVKDGADDMEVPFKLSVVHLGFDDDDEAITSCVAFPDDSALFQSRIPSGKNQQAAWKALKKSNNTMFEFADAVSIIGFALDHIVTNRRTARAKEAIDSLVTNGFLSLNEQNQLAVCDRK